MYKDIIDTIGFVESYDPELGAAMQRELGRQRQNIELIASENIVSPAVMAAMGSVLTNKYAEGYPGHRYYGGCQYVDQVEQIAIDRACKLFGAKYANVQPHSGAQANLAVYFALLNVGDTVMGMDLSQGGHLTHGSPVNMSGKNYNFVSYGVSAEDGRIDYAALAKQVAKVRPKLLVAGASAYPRAIDFEKLAEIAHGYGAMLMVDMAHIAGLVAGGQHQSPVPYADVVTTTTHKSLRGPRGGVILMKAEHEKAINSAIFPGLQGGPLMHVIAAKAVAFKEALTPEFKAYQEQVVKNAKVVAETLIERGLRIVSGGLQGFRQLGEPVGVRGDDHPDDRVAARDRVVGAEHDRQSARGHLDRAPKRALAGELAAVLPQPERLPQQTHPDPVAVRGHPPRLPHQPLRVAHPVVARPAHHAQDRPAVVRHRGDGVDHHLRADRGPHGEPVADRERRRAEGGEGVAAARPEHGWHVDATAHRQPAPQPRRGCRGVPRPGAGQAQHLGQHADAGKVAGGRCLSCWSSPSNSPSSPCCGCSSCSAG